MTDPLINEPLIKMTPSQQNEEDAKRRRDAQARRPLIAKWAPNIPTGYIHVDDAIEYMHRRWGRMLKAEYMEAFSRDDSGPKYTIIGDWPEKSRGERYYLFEDIDMWVYRTMSGVPAGWKDIRKLSANQRSTVPVVMVEDMSPTLRRRHEVKLGLPPVAEALTGGENNGNTTRE